MTRYSSSNANPSGVQGICPTGWHVPSDAEWEQLIYYVYSQSQYVCGGNNNYIAKALASTTGWSSSTNTCAVGNEPISNNATGFSAFPAGFYGGIYNNFGDIATFWSSSDGSNNGNALGCGLSCDNAGASASNSTKYRGLSVRCVRD